MCVWGGRRGPFRACGLQVPAELNSRARPSTRPLGSRAHCFLLVSLGSRLGSILDATGTVHADVMTQTISPCVPCLWTPPPRALAPAGPSVPTEGLTGSARVATVCPLLRVPPPRAWCRVYLLSPYSRPGEEVSLISRRTGSWEGEAALLGPRVHQAGRGPGRWQGRAERPPRAATHPALGAASDLTWPETCPL